MCFVFHDQAFDDVMISEYLKSQNLIISRTKRAFKVKLKTFLLVSQVPSFRHTKQTSKNVAGTTFKWVDFTDFGNLTLIQTVNPYKVTKHHIATKLVFISRNASLAKINSCRKFCESSFEKENPQNFLKNISVFY